MKALAEAATDLLWLAPGISSLVALTKAQSLPVWPEIRNDPGAVLLLARVWGKRPAESRITFSELSQDPSVLEHARDCLARSPAGFIDWSRPGPRFVYRQSWFCARLAEALARKIPGCDAELAWATGLIAPLGWQALCADPGAQALLMQLERGEDGTHGARHGAVDATAIARRLCRWWNLPDWLSGVLGHLSLPAEIARRLGADAVLFQVVQTAVLLYQQRASNVRLTIGAGLQELSAALDVNLEDITKLADGMLADDAGLPDLGPSADKFPWLTDLLQLGLLNRRPAQTSLAERLQHDIDLMQQALEDQCRHERTRLHAMKLSALGELAAGAGHEINNPLAVISGQAQYALKQLQLGETLVAEEPALAEIFEGLQGKVSHALQTIVGQTTRIYQVLTDLMQFARPTPPRLEMVGVAELILQVTSKLQDLATARGVRLVCPSVPSQWMLEVDPAQVRTILENLLRNAIEAAPKEGWAGLRGECDAQLRIIVEDNGPGPRSSFIEHLFDPFFCGRSAGRGRGLGLSTAWRLAQQHHGNVAYEGHVDGVTRFVLTLPPPMLREPSPPASNGITYHADADLLAPTNLN